MADLEGYSILGCPEKDFEYLKATNIVCRNAFFHYKSPFSWTASSFPAVPQLSLDDLSFSARDRWLHFSGFDGNVMPATHGVSLFNTDATRNDFSN